MRLAIFTNNYLPNPFGVAGSIESFRKEFERQGHTVYIFAPQTKGYVDENPNVFRYPSINLYFKNIHFPVAIPFSLKMNRVLKKLKIDVVHSQHPNLLGWEAQRWAKKKKVPLVFTWHTLYDRYAHFFPLVPEKFAAKLAISNAVRYANAARHVVVPTPSVRSIIQQWCVVNKNISAIATGVEEKKFEDAQSLRSVYGFENKIVLTLVSRLTEEKNLLFLMDAVMEALRRNDSLVFFIKGRGSLREQLQQAAKEFSERIVFAKEDELPQNVFATGDIFVYASKSETQGMVISEALYTGLPVVALRAPGAVDLVMHQHSGLLVDEDKEQFVQAILKLASDDQLRNTFSQNARRIAQENYTSKVCASQMLVLYENVLSSK